MSFYRWTYGAVICAVCVLTAGCPPLPPEGGVTACGPASAFVTRVVDGDTIEIEGGERIRYLLIDTPEDTSVQECFGAEATAFNRQLVEGQRVQLSYDVECRDRFDRLLAYVEVGGVDVSAALLRGGYACVLQIPPNGEMRASEFDSLEAVARTSRRGLWGVCARPPC